MEFKYKNEAELQAMTSEQRDQYAADKRAHDEKAIDKMITDALNAQKEALTAEVSKNAFSKDSEEFKSLEAKLEKLEKLTKDLDKSLEDIGKTKKETMVENKKVGAIFLEQYEQMEKGEYEADNITKERNAKMKIETKAFDSLNVMSVSSIPAGTYPANGTVSAVSDGYRSRYAQILGIFDVPRVYSKIMDVVDIMPLVSDTIIAFNSTITNGFAITPEGAVKPSSKIAFTSETATADPVASLFYTTLHMRRFYPSLVDRFVNTFRTLLQESIPAYVMSVVRANATAYSDVAALEWDAPTNFEAIVAMATSLKKLGYDPNMVAMSPVAYALLVTLTGSDGHYKVQNGSSIVLVGDTIKIGSMNLTVIIDAELGDDEVLVGDASEAIKVGLDSQVFYFETDGVTDNQNAVGTPPATGLARNVRTHELAQFVAVLMPAGSKGALIRDTFSNVKTLATVTP